MRTLLAVVLGFLTAGNLTAAPSDGIPRDLARQRADQISGVRYQLRFTLTPRAPSVSGHEELRFHSNSSGPVLFDFREGTTTNLAANGVALSAKIENGQSSCLGEFPVSPFLAHGNRVGSC